MKKVNKYVCKPNPVVLLERLKIDKDFRSVSAARVEQEHITDLRALVPKIEIVALSEKSEVDDPVSSSSPQKSARNNAAEQRVEPPSCHLCSKTFASVGAQKRHTKTCGGQYVCVPCRKTFKKGYRLAAHLKEVHSGEKPFSCAACSASFKRKYALRQHLLTHINGLYTCTVCSEEFSQLRSLQLHAKTHTNGSSLPCSLAFENQDADGENNEGSFNGQAEAFCIKDEGDLRTEESCLENGPEAVWLRDEICEDQEGMEYCLGIQPDIVLSVDDCSEDQRTSSSMKESLSGSQPETVWMRDEGTCKGQEGTSLKMEFSEIQPEITLIGDEGSSVQGTSVNMECSSESQPGMVSRPACTEFVASGEPHSSQADGTNLGCTHCAKPFSSRAEWIDHLKDHFDKNPSATFYARPVVSASALIEEAESSNRREYNCVQCSKAFPRGRNLRTHLKKVHSEDGPFFCPCCPAGFRANRGLREHFRIHRGETLCICTWCVKTYTSVADLKRHAATCLGPPSDSRVENKGEISSNDNKSESQASPTSHLNQCSFENHAVINSTMQEHENHERTAESVSITNEVCFEDQGGTRFNVTESLSEDQPGTVWMRDEGTFRDQQKTSLNVQELSSEIRPEIILNGDDGSSDLGTILVQDVCTLEDQEGISLKDSGLESQMGTILVRDVYTLKDHDGVSVSMRESLSNNQSEIAWVQDEGTGLNMKELSLEIQPEIILLGDEGFSEDPKTSDSSLKELESQPETICLTAEDSSEDEETSNVKESRLKNQPKTVWLRDEGLDSRSNRNEFCSGIQPEIIIIADDETSQNIKVSSEIQPEIILSGDEGTSEDEGTGLNMQELSSENQPGRIWIRKELGSFEGDQESSSNIEESSIGNEPETICLSDESGSEDQQEGLVVVMSEDGSKLCCTQCPEQFSLTADWINHYVGHFGKKPHVCSVCTKPFIDAAALERHMKSHDTGIYSCGHCSKKFMHKTTLNRHMRDVHVGGKPFSCTVCSASFKCHPSLSSHLLTHSNDKPYACTICPRRFAQARHQVRHIQTHYDADTCVCPHCSKIFRGKKYLVNHMNNVHSDKRPLSDLSS